MKRETLLVAIASAAILSLVGCGSTASEASAHAMRPPDPPSTNKVPSTKEEKIAAIEKAPIPKEQKAAAIAKVNAEP